MLEVGPARVRGEADVGERRRRRGRERGARYAAGQLAQRGFALGRQGEQVQPVGRSPPAAIAGSRRFLDDDVRVGAAEAEGADAGDALPSPPATAPARSTTSTGSSLPGDVRVRRLEVQVGGSSLVLEREHDLDQPGDAGRRLEVADVRLHRADQNRRVVRPGRGRAPRRAPAPRSGRRATCRCRAPRRSSTSTGVDAGVRQRLADHRLLRRTVGRGEAAAAAVLVDRASRGSRPGCGRRPPGRRTAA